MLDPKRPDCPYPFKEPRGYQGGLVLYQPHWPLGVIGIVASRLVERFYRPTVMLTAVDGLVKGSAHSIEGYDLFAAIRACEDLNE